MKDQQFQQAGYFDPEACDLDAFKRLIAQHTAPEDVPMASDVLANIPVYDAPALRPVLMDAAARRRVMTEWADVLMNGAGALILKRAYTETTVIDEASAIFETIIAQEKQTAGGGADHFATAGANDRIWNTLQKLCKAAPDVHMRYFANAAIAAVCEAWLGPNYQMTAQLNVVHPGGAAQQAHRDYHLGFQTSEISATYPAHVHLLSPVLTLQGGIAHCDMPVDSGPTKLLPFSQAFAAGYAAWRREDFRAVFEDNFVQIPLSKGDAVFFNPALFHAAGANHSADIHRMVNLLQVSSAFGRAMESIDRKAMCTLMYPHALRAVQTQSLDDLDLRASVAATAESYAFPTNLDRDPPKGGLAPETQQAFFLRALNEGLSADAFAEGLNAMAQRQRP
ncbi:phytanoyl-CoA dioxygenase family protein [Marivita sp. S6314]|uniref:phytanoyl-CoA dioxygenase family protein n=1 Tax=Marivita sp. S6314 TaxID=2926406 RepID=UPI001FF2D8CB|nr:phytanoyl-CoA dioxygenase family protein [Marivita sp. S6314]MCK0151650.1 phytanoyl-CoA dioxygenase family protein [Marivita sp. S6314]